MFRIGEYVVYGSSGICVVREICTLNLPGVEKDKLYYVLDPVTDRRGTVYVPVENPKLALRRMMSKEEVMELLSETPGIEAISEASDKAREERYRSCLKSCQCREWVRVLKTIERRRQERNVQGKKITAVDERYGKLAEKYLYSELAAVLELPQEEVPKLIWKTMVNC